ncbi:related to NNT1 - putative nicotinamide N-methyltransferase [Ustilago trichophora]|uniref:Related to NNT1 - putative nicotinamide N-methyltransferase n=1 Tax=Ustilago trichophora TaxID=86804 RepID=A0A5C3DY00_9BASI|nr:related to NNT1 - putative nicotinamide N-methyltransferase [Ustilago trichophora]
MTADELHDDAASIASSSSSTSDAGHGGERPHSPTSLFEDSLFTLFSHNQPAHGDPGDTCKYSHHNLPLRFLPPSTRKTTLRYRIAQNSGTNTKLFAHHQWDAGLYLADLIAEHSSEKVQGKQKADSFVDVRDKTVVELGAGTGLPGLVACVMGAERTVITDYPDPHVIANLRENLDLALLPRKSRKTDGSDRQPNPHYPQARERVQVLGLGWGNDDEESFVLAASSTSSNETTESGYDLVLAADVLWVSSAHPLLIHSIRKLLKRRREARCVLIAGFHTGRPAVRRFFVQLAQRADENDATLEEGRRAGIVPDWEEDKFGGIWERNIDGSCRAWSGAAVPRKADYDDGVGTNTLEEDAKEDAEEEMGDISDRGSWVVVASLRWADLD